jgi:hypothetical protein
MWNRHKSAIKGWIDTLLGSPDYTDQPGHPLDPGRKNPVRM